MRPLPREHVASVRCIGSERSEREFRDGSLSARAGQSLGSDREFCAAAKVHEVSPVLVFLLEVRS